MGILHQISARYRTEVKVHFVVRFGQREIIARGNVYIAIGAIGSFTMTTQIKIDRVPQISTIQRGDFEIIRIRMRRKQTGRKCLFLDTEMEGNHGHRSPPGLANRQNVSSAKKGISLTNMSPEKGKR